MRQIRSKKRVCFIRTIRLRATFLLPGRLVADLVVSVHGKQHLEGLHNEMKMGENWKVLWEWVSCLASSGPDWPEDIDLRLKIFVRNGRVYSSSIGDTPIEPPIFGLSAKRRSFLKSPCLVLIRAFPSANLKDGDVVKCSLSSAERQHITSGFLYDFVGGLDMTKKLRRHPLSWRSWNPSRSPFLGSVNPKRTAKVMLAIKKMVAFYIYIAICITQEYHHTIGINRMCMIY